MIDQQTYTAFAGSQLLATGDIEAVVLQTKRCIDKGETRTILVFDDSTGKQIDFNFQGTPEQVSAQLAAHPAVVSNLDQKKSPSGPGRPRLGVVCREISLLPRHWAWLEEQPNGISAALRRLVDDARKKEPNRERARRAREAAGRFMWSMAGDLPGFEEASRALDTHQIDRFAQITRLWPPDIREHLSLMVERSRRLEQGDNV